MGYGSAWEWVLLGWLWRFKQQGPSPACLGSGGGHYHLQDMNVEDRRIMLADGRRFGGPPSPFFVRLMA